MILPTFLQSNISSNSKATTSP